MSNPVAGMMTSMPAWLQLSSNAALQQALSDAPFVALGLLGFAMITFFLAIGKINRLIVFATGAALLAFLASILDLAQLLSTTPESLARPPEAGTLILLILTQGSLAGSMAMRFAFLLSHFSRPPRSEAHYNTLLLRRLTLDQPTGKVTAGAITLPAKTRSIMSVPEEELRGMNSAAWERWGVLGLLGYWVTWVGVGMTGVLEAIWRIGTVFNKAEFGSIYTASWILQITLLALLLLKLLSIIYLTPIRPRFTVSKEYVTIKFGMMLGAAVAIASLIIQGFSECPFGRFLQAIEIYTFTISILISTFIAGRNRDSMGVPSDGDEKRKRSSFEPLQTATQSTFRLSPPQLSDGSGVKLDPYGNETEYPFFRSERRPPSGAPFSRYSISNGNKRPSLQERATTSSSRFIGWLSSRKSGNTGADGSWSEIQNTEGSSGRQKSETDLEKLLFSFEESGSAPRLPVPAATQGTAVTLANTTERLSPKKAGVQAIVKKDQADHEAFLAKSNSRNGGSQQARRDRNSSFPTYDSKGNRLDSPTEAFGEGRDPTKAPSPPAQANPPATTINFSQTPNFLSCTPPKTLASRLVNRESAVSQAESSASEVSLSRLSLAFPPPPAMNASRTNMAAPGMARKESDGSVDVKDEELFTFQPPVMPVARANAPQGRGGVMSSFDVTSFIEGDSIRDSSTTIPDPRLPSFTIPSQPAPNPTTRPTDSIASSFDINDLPTPRLPARNFRDSTSASSIGTPTLRELNSASVQMAYRQDVGSVVSGAAVSPGSRYPESIIQSYSKPAGTSSIFPTAVPTGNLPPRIASRIPISNPAVTKQVQSNRITSQAESSAQGARSTLATTMGTAGSTTAGSTTNLAAAGSLKRYSRFERPRPAPLILDLRKK